MTEEYLQLMESYPDTVIVKRHGYFYTAYGKPALVLGNVMNYKITVGKDGDYVSGGSSLEKMGQMFDEKHIDYVFLSGNEILSSNAFSDNHFSEYLSAENAVKEDADTATEVALKQVIKIRKKDSEPGKTNKSIELLTKDLEDGTKQFEIRSLGDDGKEKFSLFLTEPSAQELYLLLGKELGFLPPDTTLTALKHEARIARKPFSLSDSQKAEVKITEDCISISEMVKNLNAVIDKKDMAGLSVTKIHAWLSKRGYVREDKEQIRTVINRTVRKMTDLSETVGITETETVDETTGEISLQLRLTPQGQRFILDNLNEIIGKP